MAHQSEKFKLRDRAPSFTLPNDRGEPQSLEALLANGPLLLAFHRGTW